MSLYTTYGQPKMHIANPIVAVSIIITTLKVEVSDKKK